MNINRDYLIINDVKKSNIKLDNGSMFFYITDRNTQNIFVNLVINVSNNDLIQKYANIENAEDYTLTMNIVKPDNTYKIIEGKLHDKEKAIFEFNLNKDCCDEIGTYRCELLTKCNINDHEEITTSNKLTYKVKSSVLNDLDDIVEAPEYPLVIQLFDKLSDIEQYEEDRRANELARQLAEEQRQTRFNKLNTDIDNKMVDVEDRISAKEEAVDTLINDTKADIDEYKVAKDQEIDNYKTAKDTEINEAITAQNNKIDTAISNQNDRIAIVENNVVAQNDRLGTLENKDALHDSRLDAIETKDTEQDGRLDVAENRLANIGNDITNTMQPIIDEHTSRLDAIEAIDVSQNNRLEAIEVKNQQQDDRLLDIEKVNKQQAVDIKCLYGASQTMDITEEGNSIYLQNGNNGFAVVDEIKGNTLVNCNKEPDKELILNGNINTSGYNTVTLTEGVDGGLVDVALEGNTMVNVCDQKDPVAITKSYTVENSGNHVALQGEYDGKCRPVVNGNTLWIDNDTEEVLTAFDETKNLRLQSSFEDKVVTQEMVDNGEEEAENLGKYRVDYIVTGKNKFDDRNITSIGGNFTYENGILTTSKHASWGAIGCLFKVPVYLVANTKYNISANLISGNYRTCLYDLNNKKIGDDFGIKNSVSFLSVNKSGQYYLVVGSSRDGVELQCSNIQLEEGSTATPYEPYKEHTKTLYLNSPLLEGDTIEQQGNNVVHVHRYGKVVLDGSDDEGWHIKEGYEDTGKVFTSKTMNINHEYVADRDTHENINFCNNMITYWWWAVINPTIDDVSEKFIYFSTYDSINQFRIINKSITNLSNFMSWIQSNPVEYVYKLASPQYEIISQNDTILCDSYVNGHLDVDSVVPIEKVVFRNLDAIKLKYLYTSTDYILQFEADNNGKLDLFTIGKQYFNYNVQKGLNTFKVTTPETLTYKFLYMNGIGFNASNIVVTEATDQEFGYFEGMKSVGECEDLEVMSSNSDGTLSNTQTLTHEPLRGVGEVKDRYVLIDGKWYIERNCGYRNNYSICDAWANENLTNRRLKLFKLDNSIEEFGDMNALRKVKSNKFKCVQYGYMDGRFNVPFLAYITENGNLWVSADINYTQQDMLNYINDCQFIYELQTPTYEPIDYNPLEVYSGVTHITTNSTIPCNMVVKNHGYNCLLKPSTTYTVSSNLGLNTVTTPSTLTEDCLRFYDTDTNTITTMKDVTILEGDYTTGKPIPSHFSGIESAFEQEYDEEKGKYKVNVKVANEDKSQENNITFYINEPLRGTDTTKDKVYIKDAKVVVQRNCGIRTYEDGDFGTYPTDKINTVYALAEPIYEEVEYNDVKLFIESFKNSTLFYNSNVPVTSKLYYSYSVPLVDKVAQTADISDQQDSMIIDLATQVSVMEMMLM